MRSRSGILNVFFFAQLIDQSVGACKAFQAEETCIFAPFLYHFGKGFYLCEESLRIDGVVADGRNEAVWTV